MAYNTKLPHLRRHPGDGYHYVICDVCGKKLRAKDATLITDKFNLLYQLLVCEDDVEETNPQQYIKSIKEKQISDPKYIRSEPTDTFGTISSPSEIETGPTS